jgi:ankyrin repeat protein
VEFHKIRLARVLMEHGASLSATFTGTYSRLTPLFYAIEHKDKEMAALILEFKPPLETVDPEGNTPLLWAVKWHQTEMARLLLEHGASVTPSTNLAGSGLRPAELRFYNINNLGNTPLHWALMRHDKEIIALLLKFKAPLDIANNQGETPLDIVRRLDDPEINKIVHQTAPATGAESTAVPSRESMQAVAKRIANGDATAFDELSTIADELYRGIDYKKDRARLLLNSDRMRAAFKVLGEEAAKGNEKAFQALKKSLGNRHLKSFAPDALGVAAAAGHKESLEILLHHEEHGISVWTANLALEAPATANLEPVVDYFATMLLNPANAHQGLFGVAKRALESAAAKGNQKAKNALDQFATALANNTIEPF